MHELHLQMQHWYVSQECLHEARYEWLFFPSQAFFYFLILLADHVCVVYQVQYQPFVMLFDQAYQSARAMTHVRLSFGFASLLRSLHFLYEIPYHYSLASTFFQSFKNACKPRSVSGCCTIFFNTANGTVAISQPIKAACVT